jgi:hypothetical protein
MMGTVNMLVGAVAVPMHPHDRARLLERARICLSSAAEALIQAEGFEPDATELVDELDRVLPRLRALVDRHDPIEPGLHS